MGICGHSSFMHFRCMGLTGFYSWFSICEENSTFCIRILSIFSVICNIPGKVSHRALCKCTYKGLFDDFIKLKVYCIVQCASSVPENVYLQALHNESVIVVLSMYSLIVKTGKKEEKTWWTESNHYSPFSRFTIFP